MRCFWVLFSLLGIAQGGPYQLKPREVAKPLVASAQWFVHERLLQVEKRVLQLSLDVGRLAQATTREAYRLTDEAWGRVEALAEELRQEAERAPGCVQEKTLQEEVGRLTNVTEDLYKCTHALSDSAASFEVAMTDVLVAGRTQVWFIQQAMWYCQKFRPEVDTDCLQRLVLEGLYWLNALPERGAVVLDKAQAAGAESLATMRDCLWTHVSGAAERQLAFCQKMRTCAEKVSGEGR